MAEKTCRINHCEATAHWTVTIDGHPNSRGATVSNYCTEHAREKAATLWEDSPKPYRITVEGPW